MNKKCEGKHVRFKEISFQLFCLVENERQLSQNVFVPKFQSSAARTFFLWIRKFAFKISMFPFFIRFLDG